MALSRSLRRTLGIASIAALLTAGLIAPPAQAAALPASINVNCVTWSTTATTITGDVGDTFTMTETSGSVGCTIAEGSAVESSSGTLGAWGTVTFEIRAAGTFTVTDSGPVAHTFTVTLSASTASSAPATYTMTFDANGGSCTAVTSSYAAVGSTIQISGETGATYNLPSAQDCTRKDYTLLGWAHSSDATVIADSNTTPGAAVNFEDDGTMYAVWAVANGFNEITYDANVNQDDFCFPVLAGQPVPDDNIRISLALYRYGSIGIFLNRTQVVSLGVDSALLKQPACSPINIDDDAYEPVYSFSRFLGWNTKADGTGTQYYAPSSGESENPFKLGGAGGQKVHLYAQWQKDPCPTVEAGTGTVAPQAFEGAQWAGCNLTSANLAGANLTGANLTDADLTGANLTGANLKGANLYDANLKGANLWHANVDMANLVGVTFENTTMPNGSIKNSAT